MSVVQCPSCKEEFPSKDLKKHSHLLHSEKLICGTLTLYRNANGQFECPLCSHAEANYSSMSNHLRRKHRDVAQAVTTGPSAAGLSNQMPPYNIPN
jgi:hypothetical protein